MPFLRVLYARKGRGQYLARLPKVFQRRRKERILQGEWLQQNENIVNDRIMDDKKAIEIPLGAKDSEPYKFEYTIPDGYEAEIKDGKVIVQKKESEDERIRKLLVWQVYQNIEDETNDLAQSVYDGIKGHDPDLEESIEDWKKCLSWLERQKEQKPTEFPKSEDYGIDGLYAVVDILQKTLGEVDGYQTDDGILEHKCAISAVKELYEQKLEVEKAAQHVYESWNGGTMDDVRRDMVELGKVLNARKK